MNLLSGVTQDFHRPQQSLGAYEWWHFDGTDEKNGYSFSIQFFAGNLFSAFYQDSLKTYWQKTKSPLSPEAMAKGNAELSSAPPPNPLDYCGVALRVFHKGIMIGEALQEFSAKFLKASDNQGAVLLGPNRFNWDERGDPPSYVLTAQAPLRGGKKLLRTRLFLTPLLKEFPNLPQLEIHSTHTWVLAAPLCHVEGTLEWCNNEGDVEKEQAFVGKGYHDHHFGSVPLDRFVKSWHWGRAFIGDETIVYSFQVPMDPQELNEGLLLTAKGTETRIWKVAFDLSQNRRNFFWLPYQKTLEFTDADSLSIHHRQILSDGPASLIFEDEVEWTKNGKTLRGFGMSNYVYTPRLSSHFFFPMLKGKTSVFTQKGDEPTPKADDIGDVTTTRPAP